MVMMTPEAIAALRQRLGMTLTDFAELVGVSVSAASYWESGDRHPKYETMRKLNELAEARSANGKGRKAVTR